jgi:hypothetical protein
MEQPGFELHDMYLTLCANYYFELEKADALWKHKSLGFRTNYEITTDVNIKTGLIKQSTLCIFII